MGWSSQREKARDGGWAGGGACGGGVDTGSCNRVQTLGGKVAADGPYEKRQMLWKEVTGRSWSGLVQQWGVPVVESLQLQESSAALIMMG